MNITVTARVKLGVDFVRLLFRDSREIGSIKNLWFLKMDESEEVWDSWEDMADSGVLDKKLQEAQKQRERACQEKQEASPAVALLQEDTQRTTYQPQLRILKRPTEAGGDQNTTENKDVNKTKQKTLAEREEEYKQARLRILGSAETDFSEPVPVRSKETSRPAASQGTAKR